MSMFSFLPCVVVVVVVVAVVVDVLGPDEMFSIGLSESD